MAASRGAYTDDYSLGPLPPISCPHRKPQLPSAFPGEPPRLTGKSDSDAYGVPALPWAHMKLCVPPPSMESLFPLVLWSSCTQASLAYHAMSSNGSSSQCQTPRHGRLTWGSELSLLWENLCNIVIFQSTGHPPSENGIAYIAQTPLLQS